MRSQEKYYRLNYRERQFILNKTKIYKNTEYKQMHKNLKLNKNENAHHWNYKLIKDVIVMDKKFHRFIHRYLILDDTTLCFKTVEGTLLDSKSSHEEYIDKIKSQFYYKP